MNNVDFKHSVATIEMTKTSLASDSELRELDPNIYLAILQVFGNNLTIDFSSTAKLLKIDKKTLRRHVLSGNIDFISFGAGAERVRRSFTARDVAVFYCRQRTSHGPLLTPKVRRRLVRPMTGFLASRQRTNQRKDGNA